MDKQKVNKKRAEGFSVFQMKGNKLTEVIELGAFCI